MTTRARIRETIVRLWWQALTACGLSHERWRAQPRLLRRTVKAVVWIAIGLVLLGIPGGKQPGIAISLFAAGSMVLAAIVLITSSPKLARSAAIQGIAPLIGVIFLAIALFS